MLSLVLLSGIAQADCPAAVRATVERIFPRASISACRLEAPHIEVKATKFDGVLVELDVMPDGTLVQIEEAIDPALVPRSVAKAFAARYAGAKIVRAEKQTPANGSVSFELAFGKREATFSSDGRFLAEE